MSSSTLHVYLIKVFPIEQAIKLFSRIYRNKESITHDTTFTKLQSHLYKFWKQGDFLISIWNSTPGNATLTCDLGWQNNLFPFYFIALSACNLLALIHIALQFSQATLLWLCCIMWEYHYQKGSAKKIISSQIQKTGKKGLVFIFVKTSSKVQLMTAVVLYAMSTACSLCQSDILACDRPTDSLNH